MISLIQLRHDIIQPALNDLGIYSENAEELLVATCCQESLLGSYVRQVHGPAYGIYMCEKDTYLDIWNNYISNNTVLKEKILKSNNYSAPPSFDHLIFNLKYATQIARIFYSRIKVPLPAKNDLEGIWNYYKVHYNTVGGKATESEFMNNYLKFVKKIGRAHV